MYTYGYFVNLQDNLISFIGYVTHMLDWQFYLRLSQTSTPFFSFFFIRPLKGYRHFSWLVQHHSVLWKHMGHMRTVYGCFCGARKNKQTAKCPFCLRMFRILVWRIVHWIHCESNKVSSAIFFFNYYLWIHYYLRIYHEDLWYCAYLT